MPHPFNVLFVISHDFGPRIGCFGDRQAVTPHMDRLAARNSLRFERHYAQWPLCGPSRANIWTGCRPPTTQRYDNTSFFPEFRRRMGPDFATLPEHFKNHGYTSAGIWHLLHGFEWDDASWDDPCWHPTLPTREELPFLPDVAFSTAHWWISVPAFALIKERQARWQALDHTLDDPRRYRGPAVEAPDYRTTPTWKGRPRPGPLSGLSSMTAAGPSFWASATKSPPSLQRS